MKSFKSDSDGMQNGSLIVVGSGIKFLSHLTYETRVYIEQSDKVLYLVNDPAMKQWLPKINAHSISLDFLYTKFPLRRDCYNAITEYILSELRQQQHICVVLYGHPSVFAQPGLNAVIQAKKEGYYAKLLPAVSAEDCLFADLLIDPGTCGCQSFEATDFLLYQRKFDPHCYVILWQVDIIGVLENPEYHDNTNGAVLLVKYLQQFYELKHEVILYEAAQYPSFEPKIQKIILKELPFAEFSRITTLFIPPLKFATIDQSILKELNINIENLKRKNDV